MNKYSGILIGAALAIRDDDRGLTRCGPFHQLFPIENRYIGEREREGYFTQ